MQRRTGRQRPERPGPTAKGSGATGHAARARTDAGFSLTESLAAILLVTLVIMGIAAGILTTVRATRTVAQTQKSEAALSDATEVLKARPYQRCADVSTYGTIPDVTVTTVEYLQAGAAGEQFAPTCDPATDTAQRITIVVGGRSADVVKRDPTAVTP